MAKEINTKQELRAHLEDLYWKKSVYIQNKDKASLNRINKLIKQAEKDLDNWDDNYK